VKLVKESLFTHHLETIILFIANDSRSRAKQFSRELQKGLNGLKIFPYKYRRSFYYESDQIRDYVFKGYTIPYLIDEEKKIIETSEKSL